MTVGIEGATDGFTERGTFVGVPVVGRTDGILVSPTKLGTVLGTTDGNSVGLQLGALVGIKVGLADVGSIEGVHEGRLLGSKEGFTLGDAEGRRVGS